MNVQKRRNPLLSVIILLLSTVLLFAGLVFFYLQGRNEQSAERKREAAIQSTSHIEHKGLGSKVQLTSDAPSLLQLKITGIAVKDSLARVPPSAILWEAGRAWIYVAENPNTFLRMPIVPVDLSHERWQVLSTSFLSVSTGKLSVVTAGAQALLSEELKSRIQTEDDDD